MRSALKNTLLLMAAVLILWWLISPDSSGCRRGRLHTPRNFGIHLPYGFEIHGLDVSRYQLHINWKKIREAREGSKTIHFVFIKATQGIRRTDPFFETNWKDSKSAGVIRGAYHYFEPDQDAAAQARHFLRQVKKESGDLPPVLDVEEKGSQSRKNLQIKVRIWLDLVEKAWGVKPILYCSPRFYEDILGANFEEYPLWIAHYYRYELRPEQAWTFWQHSDKGKIEGIKGYVDFNVFNGDTKKFQSLLIP